MNELIMILIQVFEFDVNLSLDNLLKKILIY